MISSKLLFCSSAIIGFIITLVSAQRCADQGVFDYFSCDQSCTPVGSSLSLIRRCTSLAPFGCELRNCDRGFQCVGIVNRVIQTCANSRVIFREGDPTKRTFQFTIDLNTPPLAGDYYFLVNARRKMRVHLSAVKESILEFIDSVNGSSNVRFGVGIYRNEDMHDMGYRNFKNLTRNHDAVRRVVNRIIVKHTGGGPDAFLPALVKASTHSFRPKAHKVIFAFGDTPGHEPSQVGDGDALDRASVASLLKDADISFVAINYANPGMDGDTRSFGISPQVQTRGRQARFIAKETGGVIMFQDSAFNAFWKSKASTDRKFNLKAFSCSKFINVVTGNITFPVMIRRGTQAVIPLTLRFKEGLCTPFTCQYRIIEDDTELQRFTIVVPPSTADSSC